MQGKQDFAEFMQASTNRLFRTAYLLTGDRHRAEDLTQDAFTRTYSAWSRVRNDDAYAYARRVLINLHNDWWRSRRWREQFSGEAPPVEDHAGGIVVRDSIVTALRNLTRRERSVVVLRYFADLTEVDTARELGISLGTVKSTNARAMTKLREAMQAETSELTTDISVEMIRAKAQRKTTLRAGLACALALAAAIVWWPQSADVPSMPTALSPAKGASEQAGRDGSLTSAPGTQHRTGVMLKDGREMVITNGPGLQIGGHDDRQKAYSAVPFTASERDWLSSPLPFADSPYYVDGLNNTTILVSFVKAPAGSKVKATMNGKEIDAGVAQWTADQLVFWMVLPAKPDATTPVQINAYDVYGKLLATVSY